MRQYIVKFKCGAELIIKGVVSPGFEDRNDIDVLFFSEGDGTISDRFAPILAIVPRGGIESVVEKNAGIIY